MKNTRQNIVVLRDIPEYANDISSKAVNMYMNRFCIDEDDAFELSGVFNRGEKLKKKTIIGK